MELNKYGTKRTTIEMDYNIWESAKRNLIPFHQALNFGIRFLIAEKSNGLEVDYPQSNLLTKNQKFIERIQKQAEEIEELTNHNVTKKGKKGKNDNNLSVAEQGVLGINKEA